MSCFILKRFYNIENVVSSREINMKLSPELFSRVCCCKLSKSELKIEGKIFTKKKEIQEIRVYRFGSYNRWTRLKKCVP